MAWFKSKHLWQNLLILLSWDNLCNKSWGEYNNLYYLNLISKCPFQLNIQFYDVPRASDLFVTNTSLITD